jgi:hypothetical protein
MIIYINNNSLFKVGLVNMVLTAYNLYLDISFTQHGVKFRFSLGWNVCMCRYVAVMPNDQVEEFDAAV